MINLISRLLVFIAFSTLQVRIVDAKPYAIPAENPKDCVKSKFSPCAVSTGDRPRMFKWGAANFELDRNLVMQIESQGVWNVYSGLMVVDSKESMKLHTPFADIILGQSKAMVHVLNNRVRVLSLAGEGLKVKAKGSSEENYLVPGFQNWYGGVVDGEAESGVVSVIDLKKYAVNRSKFFLNYQYGFTRELNETTRAVKWAAKMAADMHRTLIERKMASLEEFHQEKLETKRRKIQYNRFLRRLFRQKVNYDY